MSAPLLHLRGLTVDFAGDEGPVPAVRGLDLDLARGEVLGLVGESGSGKSALGGALMGLHGGAARVRADAWRLGDVALPPGRPAGWTALRGRTVAMVFQDPMTALNPTMRIGAQLREVLAVHRLAPRDAWRGRCLEALAAVGLPRPEALMDAYPHSLSGGMRQRVVVAMALLGEPQLLIADEPTTALDVTVQAQIIALLQQLVRARKMALLFITHDLAVLAGIAQRIAVMYAGQLVEVQPTDALFAAPRHPYTAALLAAMPDVGQNMHAAAHARAPAPIAGAPPHPQQLPPGCAFAPRCARRLPACSSTQVPLAQHGAGAWVRCLNPVPEGPP